MRKLELIRFRKILIIKIKRKIKYSQNIEYDHTVWIFIFQPAGSMKKVLLAFDSFKDTLTSEEVTTIVADALSKKNVKISKKMLSDGGEGFLASLQSTLNLEYIRVDVTGPLGEPIKASYCVYNPSGIKTGIIEMASAGGIEHVPVSKRNPFNTTTVGVAELINHAIHISKCEQILLGLGGSATSDGGLGMVQELGGKVYLRDANGNKTEAPRIIFGRDILRFHSFELPSEKLFPNVRFEIAVDVSNSYTGEKGAVAVFSEQKGATDEMKEQLESAMIRIQDFIREHYNVDLNNAYGTGAAGGISGMLSVVLANIKIRSGSEIVADAIQLRKEVETADIVITGEGKMDSQSQGGKVVSRVLEYCQKDKKSLIVICGKNTLPESEVKNLNLRVFDMSARFGMEASLHDSANTLRKLMEEILEKNEIKELCA